MKNKVFFVKDTSSVKVNLSGKTICIYREGFDLPNIENCDYYEFSKYKYIYTTLDCDNIVIVGLNKIFIPSIRCDLVFEYLQTMTTHINKISIDTSPFIGEPWRFWIHYSMVFGGFLNISYSYAIETEWQNWFYRTKDSCIIAPNELDGKITKTYSDLKKINSEFNFFDPDMFLLNYYNEVKKSAFEVHGTPKKIIQYMLKSLNHRIEIDFGYDSYRENKIFNLPNFGIYKFLAEENQRRQDIYNLLVGEK